MRTTPTTARLRGLYGIAGPLLASDPMGRAVETLASGRALLAAGVPVLQLRDKQSDGRALLELARVLRRECTEAGALFIVNDRVDVALLSGADGVHVGQDDLPVAEVRRLVASQGAEFASKFLIGLSTHDDAQVRSALAEDVDYVGFGPVFGTSTKANAEAARGIDRLAEAVRIARKLPVIAIGGLTLEHAAAVRSTGAAMGAVISDVARASSPVDRARALHALLGAG